MFTRTDTRFGNDGNVLEETVHVKGDNSKLLEILQEPTNYDSTFLNVIQSMQAENDTQTTGQIYESTDSSDLNLIQSVLTNDLKTTENNDENHHENIITSINNNITVSLQHLQHSPDSNIDESLGDSLHSPQELDGCQEVAVYSNGTNSSDILGNNTSQPNPETSNDNVIIPVNIMKILIDKKENYSDDIKEYLEPSELSEEKKITKVIKNTQVSVICMFCAAILVNNVLCCPYY